MRSALFSFAVSIMASAGLPLMTKAWTTTPAFWAASFTVLAFFSASFISFSATRSRCPMAISRSVGGMSSDGTTERTVSLLLLSFAMPMASEAAATLYREPSVATRMFLNSRWAARGTTRTLHGESPITRAVVLPITSRLSPLSPRLPMTIMVLLFLAASSTIYLYESSPSRTMLSQSIPSFLARALTASRCSRAAFSFFSISCGAIDANSGFVSITDMADRLLEHLLASLIASRTAPSLNSEPSVERKTFSTFVMGQISAMHVPSLYGIKMVSALYCV